MGEETEVILHSTEPTAVEATRNTIAMLGGRLEERGDRFYLQPNGRDLCQCVPRRSSDWHTTHERARFV